MLCLLSPNLHGVCCLYIGFQRTALPVFSREKYLPRACSELSGEEVTALGEELCMALRYTFFTFDSECKAGDVFIQCGGTLWLNEKKWIQLRMRGANVLQDKGVLWTCFRSHFCFASSFTPRRPKDRRCINSHKAWKLPWVAPGQLVLVFINIQIFGWGNVEYLYLDTGSVWVVGGSFETEKPGMFFCFFFSFALSLWKFPLVLSISSSHPMGPT